MIYVFFKILMSALKTLSIANSCSFSLSSAEEDDGVIVRRGQSAEFGAAHAWNPDDGIVGADQWDAVPPCSGDMGVRKAILHFAMKSGAERLKTVAVPPGPHRQLRRQTLQREALSILRLMVCPRRHDGGREHPIPPRQLIFL